MTWILTEHTARQIEDRQIGLREWFYWLLASCVSMALWITAALVSMELGRWR
jgi:hypothetical protein